MLPIGSAGGEVDGHAAVLPFRRIVIVTCNISINSLCFHSQSAVLIFPLVQVGRHTLRKRKKHQKQQGKNIPANEVEGKKGKEGRRKRKEDKKETQKHP